MDSISLQPVIPPLPLALLLLVALALLAIGPAFASLTPGRKWMLTLLRLGSILLVAVAMVRPGCVQQIERHQSAVLMFLVDATRSMEHPHVSDSSNRWDAMREMFRQNADRLKQLKANKIDVRAFAFDSQTRPIEWNEEGFVFPKIPEGNETDIGTAVYNTSLEARDQRLIGVVLASDGVQNVLDPDVELTQATEVLRDLEVPLFGVPFGLPGDAGQLADVSITNVAEQQMVNVKNDLTARATVVARGYVNQDIPVQLIIIDRDGNENVVQTKVVRPRSAYDELNLELTYRPTEPGEYRMKIRAEPMPGELAVRNNELDAFLTVNDKGMRVLYVVGDLGFEQRFLRKALSVSDFIELDFVPIYAFDRNTWPDTRLENLFRDPAYDVFILQDLDSRAVYDSSRHPESLTALADAILSGKGLLMLGGLHSFGPGRYQRTPLADILPIKMDATEAQDFGQPVRKDLHINRPVQLKPTRDHYLTRLGDVNLGGSGWKDLPPLSGANRFAGVKESALVLLTDAESDNPIMVAGDMGGRVVAFAGDQTWKWKMHGFEEQYQQFWRQVILWLAAWDAREDESVLIELPQRRFAARNNIDFGVVVKSISGETVNDAEVVAQLVRPNGTTEVVTIGASTKNYQGTLAADSVTQPGLYRVEVIASRDGQTIGQAQREFIVMDRDREKSNPVANPDQIVRLANETSEFGGQAIVPEQLGDLLDSFLANPPTTKIEIPTTWRLGETFPDAATFLGLFVALLGFEWWLRKKWGMV